MNNYGMLLNQNILLHRNYFNEMCKLIGIYVIYRAPYPGKHWTTYAELETNYDKPIQVGCIFDDHPTQKSLKKMGWIAELSENASIIHVPYDLPNLQIGALFIVPCGLDNSTGRLFRVTKLENSIVYPASIACEIIPEYEDTYVPETSNDYSNSSFNLINQNQNEGNLFA